MRFYLLVFVLVAAVVLNTHAEPKPDPAKTLRISFPRSRGTGEVKGQRNSPAVINVNSDANDDANDDVNADVDTDGDADTTKPSKNSDPSSGRLFLNKLLLFRNVFGQQQQPVIPIIITGGTGTAPSTYTSPTSSLTPIGSLPTATGTIATSPTAGTSPTSPLNPTGRGDMIKPQADQAYNGAAAVVDEKELQAALAGGAQEYVVTDQEIRGTSDGAKANRSPTRVNLRRPGAKRGQTISVRIPARYRKYFKNGQKVMLNTRNRQINRRVAQKRRNNNRNRRRRVGAGNRRRVNNQFK